MNARKISLVFYKKHFYWISVQKSVLNVCDPVQNQSVTENGVLPLFKKLPDCNQRWQRRRPSPPADAANRQILTGFFSAFSSNLKLLSSISRSWDIGKRVMPPYFSIKRWFLQSHAQSAWSHETSGLDLENQQNLSFQAISSFCLCVCLFVRVYRLHPRLFQCDMIDREKLGTGTPPCS